MVNLKLWEGYNAMPKRKSYPQRIKTLSSLQVRKPDGKLFVVRSTTINGNVVSRSLVRVQDR